MPASVDTTFRTMSVPTLQALRTSTLLQIKQVEGVGQAHSLNGRQTTLANAADLYQTLASLEAALDYLSNPANAGNKGFARRFASFNGHC